VCRLGHYDWHWHAVCIHNIDHLLSLPPSPEDIFTESGRCTVIYRSKELEDFFNVLLSSQDYSSPSKKKRKRGVCNISAVHFPVDLK
jgi:hypothetical protein